ncbi:hypothetical protein OG496_43955 [Streptomyces sp. NBC_00988]|uniref:hypothetical protein n=1 Tax=Streptomyces sp. NBC_00988 TaxID=2903704 RepID=UPI00386663E1|nr:hypothetical protein OG496_43955 [Streptomyces sp. NBC_00988]
MGLSGAPGARVDGPPTTTAPACSAGSAPRTRGDVLELRRTRPLAEIAAKFGLSTARIDQIVKGK